MNKIIVVCGPTAVGKTKLSVELAKDLNGEIINADSTQIFKELDIATAKIKESEKEGIPHHLFDIKNIDENYTVYDYQKDARQKIAEILKRGHTPILVGGTGLYIKACLYDYRFMEENINKTYDDVSNEKLYKLVCSIDSETKIHPNNRKRLIRALNYYDNHHAKMDEENGNNLLYDVCFIGLTTDRDILYNRINKRVDIMLEEGLLKEAKDLYDRNIRTKAIMTPIGYKELFPYFDGLISLDEAIDIIKKKSRNYAKKQYTWFNHQIPVTWFYVDFNNFDNTILEVKNYLK